MLEVPNRAAAKMKEMIDPNGPGYLQDKPYEAFLELRNSEAADDMTACAILHALVRGAIDDVKPGGDRISLSKAIQDKCSLQGDMADCLADIFLTLYSPSNVEQWDRMRMHGLKLFAEKPFDCSWKDCAVWDEGNGTVDCHYRAKIVLSPSRPFTVDGELAQILEQNPLMGAEAIRNHLEKDLCDHLDRAFGEYCECDDYYQPVVEDFDAEDWTAEWCRENGFELVSCEGEGHDDGYEPIIRHGW